MPLNSSLHLFIKKRLTEWGHWSYKIEMMGLSCSKKSIVAQLVDEGVASDSKGFKEREVPLNATARRALNNYLVTREKLTPKSSLFLTKQGSCPVIRTLQLAIFSMTRRAKINRIRVSAHTLRHTFANNYLKANPGNLVELAALLGHESLNTTAIYTKASKEDLAHGVERSEINIYDD